MVADPTGILAPRREQQPRRAEPPCGDHVAGGFDLDPPAVPRARLEVVHAPRPAARCARPGHDLGTGEPGHQAQRRRALQSLAIHPPEVRRQGPALQRRGAHLTVDEARHDRSIAQLGELGGIEDRIAATAPFARPLQVGGKLLIANGPADIADNPAGLEVDRVERHAPTSPDVRGAPHLAARRQRELNVVWIRARRIAEALRLRIEARAAALEQSHALACSRQLQADHDPRRPGADHRHVGPDALSHRSASPHSARPERTGERHAAIPPAAGREAWRAQRRLLSAPGGWC